MCCFSRPVDVVANTNIFARSSKDDQQFLVYSMAVSARQDLAMILPIPVPKGSKDDAVRFINLEKYPEFFKDMHAGFPPRNHGKGRTLGLPPATAGGKLPVVAVGKFEASFVPSVRDFVRLDERFRLPAAVWDELPQYKDYGFAVFKLKELVKDKTKHVHPMAFEFPRADAKQLFFPTVHIHDGKVHGKAHFDHYLFCQQGEDEQLPLLKWTESTQLARSFMKVAQAKGLVLPDAHCYQLRLSGNLKNADTLV
jgi:hypothetical protein